MKTLKLTLTLIIFFIIQSNISFSDDVVWTSRGVIKNILSADLSPDGKYLATCDGWLTDSVNIWDIDNQTIIQRIKGHYVYTVKYSPDGKYLATGSINGEGLVQVWDLKAGSLISTDTLGDIRQLEFSPDSKHISALISGSSARLNDSAGVYVCDVHFGGILSKMIMYRPNCFDYSPDGTRIAVLLKEKLPSYRDTSLIQIMNVATGEVLQRFYIGNNEASVMKYNKLGTEIIVGMYYYYYSQQFIYLNLQSGTISKNFIHSDRPIIDFDVSPDNKKVALGCGEGRFVIFNYDNGLTTDSSYINGDIKFIKFFRGNDKVIMTHKDYIVIWDIIAKKEIAKFREYNGNNHTDIANSVDISPDGEYAASASSDGTVKIWKAEDGAFVKDIYICNSPVTQARFSSDGTKLAICAGRFDNNMKILDFPSGNIILSSNNGDNYNLGLAWSKDGSMVANYGYQMNVFVINSSTGALVDSLDPNPQSTNWTNYVVFSPDGKYLATCDNSLILWEWNGSNYVVFKKWEESVWNYQSAAFSNDMKYFAYSTGKGNIFVLRTDNWSLVYTFDCKYNIPGGGGLIQGAITDISFSNDGKYLIGCVYDALKVWSMENGSELHLYYESKAILYDISQNSVALSKDNAKLISALNDGTVIRWRTNGVTPVEENSEYNQVEIFPNPAKDILNIQSTFPINNIILIDLLGRTYNLRPISNENDNYKFDVSGFTNGVYMLSFNNGNTIKNIKFIKD